MPFQSQQILKASQLNELEASIAAVDTYARSISGGVKGDKGDPGPPGATTISGITGLQSELDGKLAVSTRGAANGVAPLGSDGKVPSANLPASSGGGGVTLPISIADVTNLSTQLGARVPTANIGIPGGIVPLGNDGKIATTYLPSASGGGTGGITADYVTPVIELTSSTSTRQDKANKILVYKGTTTINVTLEARDVGATMRFIQGNTGQIAFFGTSGGTRQTSTGTTYTQPAQTVSSFQDLTLTAGKSAAVVAVLIAPDLWHISGALM